MRTVCWMIVLGLVTGCFGTSTVDCFDGTVCPASKVCAPAGGSCVEREQVAACRGKVEGEHCDLSAGAGVCRAAVCVIESCGNGVVEVDEACDDGNTISGDGCRGDCRLIEWSATVVAGAIAASAVPLHGPGAVAVDAANNVFIADTFQNRIWRVDAATGLITTVAGTGIAGFSGDGDSATTAQLAGPQGVAVDGLGHVYIADTDNQRIRRVDATTGQISTIAGTGGSGYSGDGSPATLAMLSGPSSVAVDGLGTLYIADTVNNCIRAVDITGTIRTVPGTTVLAQPRGVAVDRAGALYIADTNNHRVRRLEAGTMALATVAGTGLSGFSGDGQLATTAKLDTPRGVAVDDAGNLFIVDGENHVVRKVTAGSNIISTVAGTPEMPGDGGDGGPATQARLDGPFGVAVDHAGRVLVADTQNDRVRRVLPGPETIETLAGTAAPGFTGDHGAAMAASIGFPADVAVDGQGNVYVADRDKHRVRRIAAGTGVITTVAGTGIAGSSGDNGPATSARLAGPEGVAVDAAGNLYIADTINHRVRRVDASNTITTVVGIGTIGSSGDGGPAVQAQLNNPRGLVLDGPGNLYIADFANQRIRRVDAITRIITTAAGNGTIGGAGDGGAASAAQLSFPQDVALDASGNLYIADTNNHRVRRVAGGAGTGVITTVAGTGTAGFSGDLGPATSAMLNGPEAIAINAGTLWIADRSNHRIRRVDTGTGIITTAAGKGTPTGGFSGDGGPAIDAELNTPEGIAVDASGAIVVADTVNRKVRRVAGGRIVSLAGAIDPQGVGPLAQARLADPRALVVVDPQLAFVAGGTSGTIQALRDGALEVVSGRYPHTAAVASWARFRDDRFGTVHGIAFDATPPGTIYFTETRESANQLHAVTIADPADATTWTIAAALASTTPGFRDGVIGTALFRAPTGLLLDAGARRLYVADRGNHVIREIALATPFTSSTVTTVAGRPQNLGFLGDGGPATSALLYEPQAVVRCGNGDLFIADTGNHRIRRVEATARTITTVLGDGTGVSSGEGSPASAYAVDTPLGLACDAGGNLFVASRTTIRFLPADGAGVVDGSGPVQTIYGTPPRESFPASVTRCLTGIQMLDATRLRVADSCTGLLIELVRP